MKRNNSINLVSIIIPSFNEEGFIPDLLERVVSAYTFGIKKEIIFIDDNSTDDTKNIVKTFNNIHKHKVYYIKNKSNRGKGYSLRRGINKSKGDIVLIQDADLEYNPSDYAKLIEPFVKNNADVVYGSRFVTTEARRVLYYWHYVINRILTTVSNALTNLNLTDMETGYKVFRGNLIREIVKHLKYDDFGFEPEVTSLISKVKGLKIYEVGISYTGRTYDEGKKITWKDGIIAFYVIFRTSLLSSFRADADKFR